MNFQHFSYFEYFIFLGNFFNFYFSRNWKIIFVHSYSYHISTLFLFRAFPIQFNFEALFIFTSTCRFTFVNIYTYFLFIYTGVYNFQDCNVSFSLDLRKQFDNFLDISSFLIMFCNFWTIFKFRNIFTFPFYRIIFLIFHSWIVFLIFVHFQFYLRIYWTPDFFFRFSDQLQIFSRVFNENLSYYSV